MDVNAGRILRAQATLDDVGEEIFNLVLQVAQGEPSKSEGLGHQEFILTYKSFTAKGPACLPNTTNILHQKH
jgi:altronate hydrolase